MKRLLVVLVVIAVACGPSPAPPKKSPSPVATTPVARPSLPPFPSPTAGGPTPPLVRAWSSGGYGSWVYAWSPDGQKLTYLASDTTGVTWHLLSAAGDKTLASLGTTPARGVALDNDDIMVGFSADGQYVAVESTFTTQKGGGASAPAIQIVHLSDLKQIYMRADGTMA